MEKTNSIALNAEGKTERPWHTAYPAPTAEASSITREIVLSWIRQGKVPGKDFVLIDLRRTDFEVRRNLSELQTTIHQRLFSRELAE